MNAQLQESTDIAVIPPKPPTVTERALAVFAAVPDEEALRELAKKSVTITEITNEAGKDQCHASRMVLKNTRLEIQRVGEEGRDDAVKTSRAIIARQKALIGITQPEEDRLQGIQDAWDAKVEAEKEAKILEEMARVTRLQERVTELRGNQTLSPTDGSDLLRQHIADLESIVVDDSFQEFQQQAVEAKTTALVRLNGILGAAIAHEAAQEKLKRDQEELARLRAAEQDRQEKARTEQAERDRLAAEAQAKADADAKTERDRIAKEAHDKQVAEARAHAEQIRLDRERIAKEEAEAKAKLDAERAENDRIAAQRQAELDAQAEAQRVANAAEAKRLADERAEIARQQEEIRKANEPKPEPIPAATHEPAAPAKVNSRIVARPTAAELVSLVAEHYCVSNEMATRWLLTAKLELEESK
jgi:colicin import membrane protein